MFKRLVVCIFLTSLLCTALWCEQAPAPQSASVSVADWVLAGSVFTLESPLFQNTASLEQIASTLPSLILENLSDTGVRVLAPQEILERKLVQLRKERTNLGNSLTAAIKERDKQLFVSDSEKNLKKNLKDKEAKIQELRKQLEEKNSQIEGLELQLEQGDFQGVQEVREAIVLWNGSPESLFSGTTVKNEDINGLLTGTIVASGNYLSVTVQLTLYPGAIHAIEIQDLDAVADITVLAQELASQLKPVLQNRPMVRVAFQIEPPEAVATAKIFVDGAAFSAKGFVDKELLLPAGNHLIEVESSGFRTRTFEADFSQSTRFLATVNLEPLDKTQVTFSSHNFPDAQVYIDGIPEGTLGSEMELTTGFVFGTVLPTPQTEHPHYFVAEITPESSLTQLNLQLKRDTQEISSRIEKRRRAMYNSYSALLVSLIPSFITYGMYVNVANGWALGHESKETVNLWKNISTGSMILSAGLGVNLAVQLGLFIGAADSVLPERAKTK